MLTLNSNVAFEARTGSKISQPMKSLKSPQLTFAADQVNFSGNKSKQDISFTGMTNFLTTKTGKFGIAGVALLAMLGFAVPKARAHVITNQQGIVLQHKHEVQPRVGIYVDNHGNWSVRANTRMERLDPGMQEYERVFNQYNQPIGWQEINRVFDERNIQTRVDRGAIVSDLTTVNPQLPPWTGDVIGQVPNGGVIIVPVPVPNHHPPIFRPPIHQRGHHRGPGWFPGNHGNHRHHR